MQIHSRKMNYKKAPVGGGSGGWGGYFVRAEVEEA